MVPSKGFSRHSKAGILSTCRLCKSGKEGKGRPGGLSDCHHRPGYSLLILTPPGDYSIIFSHTLSASLGQLVIVWFNFDLQEKEYLSCMSI